MEDVSTSHTCLTLFVTIRLSRSVDLKFPHLTVRTSVKNQRGKTSILIFSGGSGGDARDARAPVQFFHFHAVFGKN